MSNLFAALMGFVVSFTVGGILCAIVFRGRPEALQGSLRAGAFSSAVVAVYIYFVR